MLKSMTGFGQGDCFNEEYRVHAEVRSVNQRYLEIGFHMPRSLYAWENELRKHVKKAAARGKLELQISVTDLRQQAASVQVNRGLALSYRRAMQELAETVSLPLPEDVTIIANCPDVLAVERDSSFSGIEAVLFPAVDQALSGLDAMRVQEGNNIGQDFDYRLNLLGELVDRVEALEPRIVERYRERIRGTLQELLAENEIDEMRLIQEVALYSDRVNFTEEIIRLRSHLEQFRVIRETSDEAVGRKLDFLVQEMNREVNTIGSKANHAEAARIVVDMKSEMEKIREQIQNIE